MKKLAFTKLAVLAIVLGISVSITGCGEGDPGPQGVQGEPGMDGKDGEDGSDGKNGVDGKDSPNKSFYFQNGFKGYAGTVDNHLSSLFPTSNYGDMSLWLTHSTNTTPQSNNTLIIRFDDIDEAMLPYLDDPDTEGNADDFYINEAVLYLYCFNMNIYSTYKSGLKLELTFYDQDDPLFAENISTWNFANEVQPWAVGEGGNSNGYWLAAYSGGYYVGLPVDNELSGKLGWIALPLPRQVVKSWVNDADNWNKGLRVRLIGNSEDGVASLQFENSETYVEYLRPLLFVNGEPANATAGGRIAEESWEDRLAEWESMSHEQKMAPLNKYLSTK